jgi:hypothetical protein
LAMPKKRDNLFWKVGLRACATSTKGNWCIR